MALINIPPKFNDRLIIDVRWTLYADFLDAHQNYYSQVLLTDVRDVIFQGDPFEHRRNQKYLGYATEGNLIGQSDINERWMKNFLGVDTFNALKDKPIICCGTVWGTVDEVITFARMMETALETNTFWGAEQAAANDIIYNRKLPFENIVESNVQHGEILTLAWDNTGTNGDFIINGSGEVPAVVHMYTSHNDLIAFVNRLYRISEWQSFDNFRDLDSLLDAVLLLLHCGKHQIVFNMLMYLTERYSDGAAWKKSLRRLERIFQFTTTVKDPPFRLEIIELTAMRALMIAYVGIEISPALLDLAYKIFVRAKDHRHTIYRSFEQFLSILTRQAIEALLNKNRADSAAVMIERLETIEHNLDDDMNFKAAEINRRLGRKDKALEYYKKLLDI